MEVLVKIKLVPLDRIGQSSNVAVRPYSLAKPLCAFSDHPQIVRLNMRTFEVIIGWIEMLIGPRMQCAILRSAYEKGALGIQAIL